MLDILSADKINFNIIHCVAKSAFISVALPTNGTAFIISVIWTTERAEISFSPVNFFAGDLHL
jgi:hypothetical protein